VLTCGISINTQIIATTARSEGGFLTPAEAAGVNKKEINMASPERIKLYNERSRAGTCVYCGEGKGNYQSSKTKDWCCSEQCFEEWLKVCADSSLKIPGEK
jgi:hypothetical protein